MKKIFKEPFLHFILIGVALFFLYGLVDKKTDSKDTILINDFDISNIIASWEMQWKRMPTEKELQNLINLNIKQEIFYQEALNMNLDHNDEIIKRRLAQKMQFLSNDIASTFEPTDSDLQAYLEKNIEKYLRPYSYSLYQITFTPDKRKDHLKDASEVLKKFGKVSFKEMENKGDNLPFSYQFNNVTADELALQLGSKFPDALVNQEVNKWVGPIPSGFGYHIIFITEKTEPRIPSLEEVRKEVTRDFEYDYQKELDESIYQELKKQYNIQIDIKSEDIDPKFVEFLQEEINK